MAKNFKWGIIGPGRIAQKFAAALEAVPNASLHAVASRDPEKAKQFAGQYHAPVYYGDYASLAGNTDIDAVYIATPHTYHHAHVLLCLQQKKAVLCEKPMSVNHASTVEMVATARTHNSFLMEAMWSRFLPIIDKTQELIKQGEIGELKYLRADFGFAAPFNPDGRLFDVKLGGGSLLDVGVYPLFLALLIMGKPDEIKSFAQLSVTGADETTNALLYYKNGMMANILSSIVAQTPLTAEISGSEGTIILDRPWYKGTVLHVRKKDVITQTISLPYGDNGFEYQIQEVQQCLEQNLKESLLLPLHFSLLMSSVAEQINKISNIAYNAQITR
ncbi:MAG: Gfo/Idh/MocA family oxidoreductase [Chitinophagaceae bacterium]